MRRVVIRLLAIVLLLGQVAQVSGGAFCGLQRHHASHCDDAMQQKAGASLTAPAHDMASGLCALMGPCAPPVPAVTASVASDFTFAVLHVGASSALAQLVSFHPAPIPPPPQV